MIALLEIVAAVLMILLMVIIAGSITIDTLFSDEEDKHDQR